MRSPEKLAAVIEDMPSLVPGSCRALARKLKLDRMTVWRWRQRIIKTPTDIGGTAFGGIVEADEKLFRESRKGSREWVGHLRRLDIHPAPDRLRRHDCRKHKIRMQPGISKWQIPVLTITDRAGLRRAAVLPNRHGPVMMAMPARPIDPDAGPCSDGDSACAAFAQACGIPHYRLNASVGIRVINRAFHIQTVNNLHRRFEEFMKPFRGPATRNLPGHAARFVTRPMGNDAPRRQPWRSLLAA